MRHFKSYILLHDDEEWMNYQILSRPVYKYMIDAASLVSDGEVTVGQIDEGNDTVLVFIHPIPAVRSDTIEYLTAQTRAVLMSRGEPLAVYGSAADAKNAVVSGDFSAFEKVEAPPADGCWVRDAVSAYSAQEQIRERINMEHMKRGVRVISPQTTHISPDAVIGRGTIILPGCLIYKKTVIGEGCSVGPNCLLENAKIGNGTSVNQAQIYDSSVGEKCTVGPFVWIRPGCEIGDCVRIGDFVELKNARIGNGTKVSHLTYIGDARFGENINVGCGVVVVNYDGKIKNHTEVGDGSFIGCNVNLVAPVTIGRDVYVAAGSTITDDVEDGALAIARPRQEVIPGWVQRKKEIGEL